MTGSKTVRVTTANLNGIRAAYRRGFDQWLLEASPDVLLLQEVRADHDIAADLLGDRWHTYVYPSHIKGRAGVAVAVRKDSDKVAPSSRHDPIVGLGEIEEPVDSGRWLEVVLDSATGSTMRVVSAYFHSGAIDTPKQTAKMAHLELISARLSQLLDSSDSESAVVAGDFNIVRGPDDLKNWKANHNKASGALDEEIAYLDEWANQGWADVVRQLAGDGPGPYSWWSWRGKAFDNNVGWRIDYHYATPELGSRALDFDIYRAPAWDGRFSDHAPVTVGYRL